MLALPGGPATIFSSYTWARNFTVDADGTPRDGRWYLGPPRAADGSTAPASCDIEWHANGSGTAGGARTGEFGSGWNCEHRHPKVVEMTRWRKEVAGSWELLHLRGSQDTVSFGRCSSCDYDHKESMMTMTMTKAMAMRSS